MSYTSKVKGGILKKEVSSTSEKLLELYGALYSKGAVKEDKIDLKLENLKLAERYYNLLKDTSDLQVFTKSSISKKLGEHYIYSVQVPKQAGFKEYVKKISKYSQEEIVKEEKLHKGFLRGVFLTSGYIKDPEKEYSLDFFIGNADLAEKLYNILIKMGKKVFKTKKRNKELIYLRNSEDIMDILVFIDSIQEYFKFEEVSMMKGIKNKTIREMNWEVANEMKSLNTGKKQLKMINYIDDSVGIHTLTSVLQEVARLRIEMPESSLTEIADRIGLSKSGIRNRFRRIEAIYEKLLAEERKEKDNENN